MKTMIKRSAIVALAAGMVVTASAGAEEIPPNTIVTSANIGQYKDMTIDGVKFSDMLTPATQYLYDKENYRMKVHPQTPWKLDPNWIAATKANTGKVKLGADGVTGWTQGVPFPELNESDPDIAKKIAWNIFLARPLGNSLETNAQFFLVNGEKGPGREQQWFYQRIWEVGRFESMGGGEYPTASDGEIHSKTLLVAQAPRDIKGLGTYTVFYMDPAKKPDIFAYIKSVRRIRRVSGGGWFDPVGGFDMLQDDINLFNAHPSWYSGYKYLGKKTVLAGRYGDERDAEHGFGRLDLDTMKGVIHPDAPYWNFSDETVYEPRETHVIEITMPEAHPYGKKVLYYDHSAAFPVFGEGYDKAGKLWRVFVPVFSQGEPISGAEGYHPFNNINNLITSHIDIQKRQATIYYVTRAGNYQNADKLSSDYFGRKLLGKAADRMPQRSK